MVDNNPLQRRPRVLLCATGSVASVKLAQLAEQLLEFADVRIALSRAAQPFVKDLVFPDACLPLLDDEGEWRSWQRVGDPVQHIELRRWADLLVIAPLSADSLAKIAAGICDNLVLSVVRAWDLQRPVLIAPAMNTVMWEHPFTARHLSTCREELGMHVVGPIAKRLACADVGLGAMAEPVDIAEEAKRLLSGLKLRVGDDDDGASAQLP